MKIATVRIYDAVLSADDVAQNYAAGVLAASTDAPIIDATQVGSDIQISWS
jgi:hypothetical protein